MITKTITISLQSEESFSILDNWVHTVMKGEIEIPEDPNAKTIGWPRLVKSWHEYYQSRKSGIPPNFTNGEPKALKELMKKLRKVAVSAKVVWNEDTAVDFLSFFLSTIQNKFILSNLQLKIIDSKFDILYDEYQKRKSGNSNTPTRDIDREIALRYGQADPR